MAHKKKQKHHEEEGGEAWLLPYSDLMTLLLAVFIVLFAVSKIDEEKAKDLAGAFREEMMTDSESVLPSEGDSVIPLENGATQEENPPEESNVESNTDEETTSQEETTSGEENTSENPGDSQNNTDISEQELEEFLGAYELDNMEELQSELEIMIQNEGLTSEITTSIDKRGLIISLRNAVFFDSGSAEIKSENNETLIGIAKIINRLDNYIRIEGHTDNIPMNSGAYPSNWELSTARAASVVRLFIDKCNVSPEKVVAVGYGEYKPIADNSTAEGRAQNRRIDIIVLSEKYNNLEN